MLVGANGLVTKVLLMDLKKIFIEKVKKLVKDNNKKHFYILLKL